MMTRKDFKLIAEVFYDHLRTHGPEVEVEALAHRMSEKLVQTNPRFDKAKFLEACGIVK
jgi:hypothetical protein